MSSSKQQLRSGCSSPSSSLVDPIRVAFVHCRSLYLPSILLLLSCSSFRSLPLVSPTSLASFYPPDTGRLSSSPFPFTLAFGSDPSRLSLFSIFPLFFLIAAFLNSFSFLCQFLYHTPLEFKAFENRKRKEGKRKRKRGGSGEGPFKPPPTIPSPSQTHSIDLFGSIFQPLYDVVPDVPPPQCSRS